jgi:hypothetical protein
MNFLISRVFRFQLRNVTLASVPLARFDGTLNSLNAVNDLDESIDLIGSIGPTPLALGSY